MVQSDKVYNIFYSLDLFDYKLNAERSDYLENDKNAQLQNYKWLEGQQRINKSLDFPLTF